MKLRHKSPAAFTLIELLVVISIIAILASLAVPAITGALVKGQLTQTMNNGRQVYLATFQMANDNLSTGDPKLGWPGDLSQAAQNPVTTVKAFFERLMDYQYVNSSDVIKISNAPGVTTWDGSVGTFDGEKNCAFKIYQVTGGDGASNIFLATKNFTYNQDLDANKVPYKDKGFVVVRKGGDGAAYKPKQSKSVQTLGLLPGQTDFTTTPSETPAMLLNQS